MKKWRVFNIWKEELEKEKEKMVDKTELHGVILSVLSERWELSATLPTAKVKKSL